MNEGQDLEAAIKAQGAVVGVQTMWVTGSGGEPPTDVRTSAVPAGEVAKPLDEPEMTPAQRGGELESGEGHPGLAQMEEANLTEEASGPLSFDSLVEALQKEASYFASLNKHVGTEPLGDLKLLDWRMGDIYLVNIQYTKAKVLKHALVLQAGSGNNRSHLKDHFKPRRSLMLRFI